MEYLYQRNQGQSDCLGADRRRKNKSNQGTHANSQVAGQLRRQRHLKQSRVKGTVEEINQIHSICLQRQAMQRNCHCLTVNSVKGDGTRRFRRQQSLNSKRFQQPRHNPDDIARSD